MFGSSTSAVARRLHLVAPPARGRACGPSRGRRAAGASASRRRRPGPPGRSARTQAPQVRDRDRRCGGTCRRPARRRPSPAGRRGLSRDASTGTTLAVPSRSARSRRCATRLGSGSTASTVPVGPTAARQAAAEVAGAGAQVGDALAGLQPERRHQLLRLLPRGARRIVEDLRPVRRVVEAPVRRGVVVGARQSRGREAPAATSSRARSAATPSRHRARA